MGALLQEEGLCLGRRRGGLEGRKEKLPLVEGGGMPGGGMLHEIFSRGVKKGI